MYTLKFAATQITGLAFRARKPTSLPTWRWWWIYGSLRAVYGFLPFWFFLYLLDPLLLLEVF